jgi:hypothetical protein
MKKSTNASFLVNEPKYKAGKGRPQLLRIEFSPEFTKVDFGYQTTSYYIKGGWVRISKDTFIRLKSTGEKYTLTRADNIPIAPVHHHFNTSKDWLYFSLYFPAIDFKSGKIDLIEAEPGDPTDFNYFDIEIDTKKGMELR